MAADRELAEQLLVERDGPHTLGKALEEAEALLADEIGDPTGNLATYRNYLLARIAAVEAFRRQQCSSNAGSSRVNSNQALVIAARIGSEPQNEWAAGQAR